MGNDANVNGILLSVETPLAIELREMLLIKRSIERSMASILLWGHRPDTDDEDDILIDQALFRDATTRFIACFDSAVAHNLDPDSVYGTGEHRSVFDWMKTTRDTWGAHRSGPQEQAYVGYVVNAATYEFLGAGHLVMEALSPAGKLASPQLVATMEVAHKHVVERVERASHRLEAVGKDLTPRQMKRLPEAQARVPTSGQLRIGRTKFDRKSRSGSLK